MVLLSDLCIWEGGRKHGAYIGEMVVASGSVVLFIASETVVDVVTSWFEWAERMQKKIETRWNGAKNDEL